MHIIERIQIQLFYCATQHTAQMYCPSLLPFLFNVSMFYSIFMFSSVLSNSLYVYFFSLFYLAPSALVFQSFCQMCDKYATEIVAYLQSAVCNHG